MSKFRKSVAPAAGKRQFRRHVDNGRRANIQTTPTVLFVKRSGKRM